MRSLRTSSLIVVLAATAVTLSGCVPSFLAPQAQQSQPATAPTQPPAEPVTTDPSATDPGTTEPATGPTTVSEGSYGPVTVDDGAGDTWTYTVDGVVVDVPVDEEVPAGQQVVGLLISATHDDGTASFTTCFDVELVTDSGSYLVGPETWPTVESVLGNSEDLQGAVAAVTVPEGSDLNHWVITSRYGDDVQEITYG